MHACIPGNCIIAENRKKRTMQLPDWGKRLFGGFNDQEKKESADCPAYTVNNMNEVKNE